MPNVGVPELIVIFMILLLVFGGSRLPQIGEGMGRAIRGFKRGMASDDRIKVSAGKVESQAKSGVSDVAEAADADIVEREG